MKNKVFAVAGVAAVALLTLAGCQAISDQVNQKVGEKVTEKLLENASGGKVQIDTNSGSMNIKTDQGDVKLTSDGNNMVIKGSNGEAMFGGGDARPAGVSADLPNLEGAKEYAWIGSTEGGMFSFNVPGTDYKAACTNEMNLLTSAGWVSNDKVIMDFGTSMTRMMDKGDFNVNVSCSSAETDKVTSVILVESKKTN